MRHLVTIGRIAWIAGLLALAGCGRVEPPAPIPAGVVAAAPVHASSEAPSPPPGRRSARVAGGGVAIEASLTPIRPGGGSDGPRAGDDVRVQIRLADADGRPLAGVRPAAWLVPGDPIGPLQPPALNRRVAALVRGDRLAPPEIDFNQYHVAALNDDATITVVDPLAGFGGTKLLAQVALPGVGADWALAPDARRLFVSIPAAGRVVAIDAAAWVVAAEAGDLPGAARLALQGDGRTLWVDRVGGVSALDAGSLAVVARVETGVGPHAIALDPEDRRVFVADAATGVVTVVDGATRTSVGQVAVGGRPVAVAYSTAGHAAYVVDGGGGPVAIVGGSPPALVGRVEVGGGASAITFAPDGRTALVAHPDRDVVSVIDAAVNRVVRTVAAEGSPDQVVCTDRFAYLRGPANPMVRALPLDGATRDGIATVLDIPGGQRAPGEGAGNGDGPDLARTLAPAIARAAGEGAVLIANPADRAIYYYQEGMSAPSGSFRNASHAPRAVRAIDRSLRAAGPGIFETVARLRTPGAFDLIVLLDQPRVAQALRFDVAADPAQPPAPAPIEVAAEPLAGANSPRAGQPDRVAFRVREAGTGLPVADLAGVRVRVVLHGRWQGAGRAESGAEPGLFTFAYTPPEPGTYHFFVEVPDRPRAGNPWSFAREVGPPP